MTPSGKAWVSDHEAKYCFVCNEEFSLLVRKHHCRHCGEVICSSCSSSRSAIAGLGSSRAVRVCDRCVQKRGASPGAPAVVIANSPARLLSRAAAASGIPMATASPSCRSPLWQPNRASKSCSGCEALFTFVRRRHHCRSCGLLFCNPCSSKRVDIEGYPGLQRVCDACFKEQRSGAAGAAGAAGADSAAVEAKAGSWAPGTAALILHSLTQLPIRTCLRRVLGMMTPLEVLRLQTTGRHMRSAAAAVLWEQPAPPDDFPDAARPSLLALFGSSTLGSIVSDRLRDTAKLAWIVSRLFAGCSSVEDLACSLLCRPAAPTVIRAAALAALLGSDAGTDLSAASVEAVVSCVHVDVDHSFDADDGEMMTLATAAAWGLLLNNMDATTARGSSLAREAIALLSKLAARQGLPSTKAKTYAAGFLVNASRSGDFPESLLEPAVPAVLAEGCVAALAVDLDLAKKLVDVLRVIQSNCPSEAFLGEVRRATTTIWGAAGGLAVDGVPALDLPSRRFLAAAVWLLRVALVCPPDLSALLEMVAAGIDCPASNELGEAAASCLMALSASGDDAEARVLLARYLPQIACMVARCTRTAEFEGGAKLVRNLCGSARNVLSNPRCKISAVASEKVCRSLLTALDQKTSDNDATDRTVSRQLVVCLWCLVANRSQGARCAKLMAASHAVRMLRARQAKDRDTALFLKTLDRRVKATPLAKKLLSASPLREVAGQHSGNKM